MHLTEENHNRDSGADLIKQKKETVNLKTSHLKLFSLRNIKTREGTKMKRAYEIYETPSITEHQIMEVS